VQIFKTNIILGVTRTRRSGLVRLFRDCGRQMGLAIAEPRTILLSCGPRDQIESAIFNNLKSVSQSACGRDYAWCWCCRGVSEYMIV